MVQDTDRYIRLRVYKVQGPVCHITCNVESGMIIVVGLNFFEKKTMSAGLYNLDLKNSYLSSMTFSKHL